MGKQHSDIKDFHTKSRRKMVVIINLKKNKRATQHFSNVASCVLLRERGFYNWILE